MTRMEWSQGRWTTPPVSSRIEDGTLVVTAGEGSDAWRITSYGFVHDDEHALIAPFAPDTAVEVTFEVALRRQFDQAGCFLRADAEHWVKAGIEFADGFPQLGAVVTDRFSDWSVAPVPDWNGRVATIRASRSGDAVTIRARIDQEPWRLVRLVPMDPDAVLEAGPYCCAPTRAGFEVRFVSWEITAPDEALH